MAIVYGEGDMDKIARVFIWLVYGTVLTILLTLTPIGGVVHLIVSGISVICAGYLLFSALFSFFDFENYNSGQHWRALGLKVVGASVLIGIVIVASLVLPKPPLSGNDKFGPCHGGPYNDGDNC